MNSRLSTTWDQPGAPVLTAKGRGDLSAWIFQDDTPAVRMRSRPAQTAGFNRRAVRDAFVSGSDSRCQVIRSADTDLAERDDWPTEGVICSELTHYRIAHLGIADVTQSFRLVRTRPRGAFFLACFGGKGHILVNNRWRACGAGMACLLPQGNLSALEAAPHARWQFCWIHYQPSPEKTPFNPLETPVMERFDGETLRLVITGLSQACVHAAVPSAIHHWLELIQTYTQSFGGAWQKDERLLKLWTEVQNNLHLPWTGDQLARQSHMCFEHLRRLCQRQLGRSPMHQVTFLRMRRAAELLASTDGKVEAIAADVGYSNSFAFSVAFKRWTGWPPSEFRRKNKVPNPSHLPNDCR